MKILMVLASLLIVVGCTSNPKTQITQQVGTGTVITGVVSSKHFSKIALAQVAENARTACFENQADVSQLSDVGQAAHYVAQAAGKGTNCGAGINDVAINKDNQFTERFGIGTKLLATTLPFLFTSRSKSGTNVTVNGNNNQTSTGDASPNSDSTTTGVEFSPVDVTDLIPDTAQ